jgi:hypothetical protein
MGDLEECIAVQLRKADEYSGQRSDRAESEQWRDNANQQAPADRESIGRQSQCPAHAKHRVFAPGAICGASIGFPKSVANRVLRHLLQAEISKGPNSSSILPAPSP